MTAKTRGFTLIELLIALAILGILAGIAYPAYTGYVTRARQSAAQQFIMDIANAEETYRADALTYVAAANATAINALFNLNPSKDATTYYAYSITNVTPTTYTITAVPQSGQTGGNLSLDQAGAKTGWQ